MNPPLLSLQRALLLIVPCVIVHNGFAQNGDDSQQGTSKNITWTDVPTVDTEDPTLQRGIVYDPDGNPLAGAVWTVEAQTQLIEPDASVPDPGNKAAISGAISSAAVAPAPSSAASNDGSCPSAAR